MNATIVIMDMNGYKYAYDFRTVTEAKKYAKTINRDGIVNVVLYRNNGTYEKL